MGLLRCTKVVAVDQVIEEFGPFWVHQADDQIYIELVFHVDLQFDESF